MKPVYFNGTNGLKRGKLFFILFSGGYSTELANYFKSCWKHWAETRKPGFRSTHELEKVWQWILLDQYLLSEARYIVKSKSGIRSERKGEEGFCYVIPSSAWKRGCRVHHIFLLLFLHPYQHLRSKYPVSSKYFLHWFNFTIKRRRATRKILTKPLKI